jgi:hypothetical protein
MTGRERASESLEIPVFMRVAGVRKRPEIEEWIFT